MPSEPHTSGFAARPKPPPDIGAKIIFADRPVYLICGSRNAGGLSSIDKASGRGLKSILKTTTSHPALLLRETKFVPCLIDKIGVCHIRRGPYFAGLGIADSNSSNMFPALAKAG
jgi:hypothetical protein